MKKKTSSESPPNQMKIRTRKRENEAESNIRNRTSKMRDIAYRGLAKRGG